MLDQTGLNGTFDFTLEWKAETSGLTPQGAGAQPDSPGPTFQEAIQEQLGLKLNAIKAPMRVLIVDHIQRPTEN